MQLLIKRFSYVFSKNNLSAYENSTHEKKISICLLEYFAARSKVKLIMKIVFIFEYHHNFVIFFYDYTGRYIYDEPSIKYYFDSSQ